MIFDWKNNKDEALKNGLVEDSVFGTNTVLMQADNGVIANHTFCNFDNLKFEGEILIENCVFENCTDITFDKCQIKNCLFKQIETIFATESNFVNSKFSDLVCDNDMIISLENSKISRCSFDKVKLFEDAYLFDGVGDSWIEHSSFSNIYTNREDQEIAICEETRGTLRKRKVQFELIDENTCTGL